MDIGKGKLVEMITNLTKANIVLSKEVVKLKRSVADVEVPTELCPDCGDDSIEEASIEYSYNSDTVVSRYQCYNDSEACEAVWLIHKKPLRIVSYEMINGTDNRMHI